MASIFFGNFIYENGVTPTLVFLGGTTHEIGTLRIFNADLSLRAELRYDLDENEWLRYTDIVPHTTYVFKAKADTETDWSYTNFCCSYTYDESVYCSNPQYIAVTKISETSATFQFVKGSNAYYSYLTLEPTSYSGAYRYGETAGTTCTVENLDPATEYYGWIDSVSIDGKTRSNGGYVPTLTTYGGANGGVATFAGFPIVQGQEMETYEQNGIKYCIVVTALLWNNYTIQVNNKLSYSNKPTHVFPVINSGDAFTASVYNEAIDALKPVGATDADKVVTGDPITAQRFRRLEYLVRFY